MPSSDFLLQALLLLTFSLPLLGALAKVISAIGSMRRSIESKIEALDKRVTTLDHQQQMKALQYESLHDHVQLTIKGIQEVVGHLRTRTRSESDKLADRVSQMEKFLVKTSDFTARE